MLNLEQEHEKERQFICACGKAYFSYAALFTHVKQKHNGKAPGPIIKPKPENKRGRPRKIQAETQGHSATQSPSARKSLSKIQDMPQSNCGYQNQDSKQSRHIFKPKAGSTFKHYQAQESCMPTVQQLPATCSFQIELLQDLSRSLQFKFLNSVPEIILKKLKTYQMIEDGAQHGDIVNCMRSFLNFCKDGVRKQTHSQLVLLMSMLLQHIIVSQKEKLIVQLSINDIHKHIISFFEYVTQKYKQIDLTPYDYNKISYSVFQLAKQILGLAESKTVESVVVYRKMLMTIIKANDVYKLISIVQLRQQMDIVFSNRVAANIFKECARSIIDNRQYNEAPIEMRKKIEDCLDTYMEHHNIVMTGMSRMKIQPGLPPKA